MFYKETNFHKTDIGMIPRDWVAVEIEEVVEINKESRDPAQKPHASFLYIDIESIENGTGVISEPKEMLGRDAPSRARRVVHENDVIMSTVRPYLKAFTLIPMGLDNEICSTGFAVFSCKPSIIPKYLLSYLFSNTVINQCRKMMVGAQYPALNESQVSKIKIPLAYIGEQQKLAEVFSSVDAALNETREIIAKVERLKQGLMQELLTKGIGHKEFKYSKELGCKIPKDWEVKELKDIGTFQYGYTASAENENTGIKFLRITDIEEDGDVDWGDVPYCSIDDEEYHRYELKEGDILFARIGATAGKTSYINRKVKGIFASYLIRFKALKEINGKFVFYFTQSKLYWSQALRQREGQLKKGMNANTLSHLRIAVPNMISEQQRIAEVLTGIDERLAIERTEKTRLERIKQGLMDVLLTGKIRVKV